MLIHRQSFWVLCPWPKWGSPTSSRITALHRRFHWWEFGNLDIEDEFLKYTVKAFLLVLKVWGVLMRLAIWPSSVFQEVKSCQFKVFCFVFSKYSPIHLDVLHRPWKKILLDILCLTVCSSYYAYRSRPLWLLVGCRKHHPLSQWLSPKQGIIKTKIFGLYFVFQHCSLQL